MLLTHLHMDHIQGLGFFDCLFRAGFEVHIWGPASTTMGLRARLGRYLSPPLFPVRLRDLPASSTLHDVPLGRFEIPGFVVHSALVCHPGAHRRLPARGRRRDARVPVRPRARTRRPRLPRACGVDLGVRPGRGADLLIHDAQYTDAEYPTRVGWGHSAISHAVAFVTAVGARTFVPFHYDPTHDDTMLDRLYASAAEELRGTCPVVPAREGETLAVTAA